MQGTSYKPMQEAKLNITAESPEHPTRSPCFSSFLILMLLTAFVLEFPAVALELAKKKPVSRISIFALCQPYADHHYYLHSPQPLQFSILSFSWESDANTLVYVDSHRIMHE
jgi:hypothetical protein